MGGKIDVFSEVGIGTKFRIWIPFQETVPENTDRKITNQTHT
jgi:two-component system NtrC family sensor kinase